MDISEETLCSVDGCGRGGKSKGMCRAHYMRARRGTDLAKPLRTYAPGSTCSVDDCERPVQSRDMCKMHAKRDRVHGDPGIVKRGKPGYREQHPRWLGDEIGYKNAHLRAVRKYGSASTYDCVDCGGRAHDWAYNHSDPNPLIGYHNGSRLEYSGNPECYIPLCSKCHKADDAAHRAKREIERFKRWAYPLIVAHYGVYGALDSWNVCGERHIIIDTGLLLPRYQDL